VAVSLVTPPPPAAAIAPYFDDRDRKGFT